MKITITVNGKQIEAEVDEKAFKEATEKKKPTGYEKTIPIYFYHAPDGFCRMGRVSDNDSSIECACDVEMIDKLPYTERSIHRKE